ncbi:MAG: hypothetical protein H0T46_29280 [Deltaproteobacteria bacterium]|nr:hypothetical protein [Deltaproteobacteria bacterium]
MRRSRLGLVAIVAALAACQGKSKDPEPGPGTASTPKLDAAQVVAGDAALLPPEDAPKKPDEVEAPDPGKVIAELGAISAWQAVIDRAQLLVRRGQHGIVYGRVGPVIMIPDPMAGPPDAGVKPPLIASPYTWLVDDTEGNGTLGIRVKLDGKAKEGERVALDGAWDLDDNRAWYWRVTAVQPVPAAAPSDIKDPPAPVPSHTIVNGDLPNGARTITVARDGDAVYFQIVGRAPTTEGDGWQVADELGDTTFALLNLPGERPSYGGQDMRQPDEKWVLKRGQTYWVRIGKLRKRGPDKPVLINARTAPVRVM